jgi:UV DNA damage endonuclease
METVRGNLDCLKRILAFNKEHGIHFFRISSDLVPFASHQICTVSWQKEFEQIFNELGQFILSSGFRINMHPDQFTLINAVKEEIFKRSVSELTYHAEVLDLLGLKKDAKIQIHVGGAYGDKPLSMDRFASRYKKLPASIKKRLVIENDERLYSLRDCLEIFAITGCPVVLDTLHHELNNNGESLLNALRDASDTWTESDGSPIIDYSSQAKGKKKGSHASSIDSKNFKTFLHEIEGIDVDIMLEIKNKEKSALKALRMLHHGGLGS